MESLFISCMCVMFTDAGGKRWSRCLYLVCALCLQTLAVKDGVVVYILYVRCVYRRWR